jgi:transcriptional regulator with XRE-family HTH domain
MIYYPHMASRQKPTITKELGSKLKEIREKANLTQEEVAKEAGMSSNYYAKIERGEINTTLEKLYKIIKALKTQASEIFPS